MSVAVDNFAKHQVVLVDGKAHLVENKTKRG
jgi:hypothetical protein